jgi:hypothetical protein
LKTRRRRRNIAASKSRFWPNRRGDSAITFMMIFRSREVEHNQRSTSAAPVTFCRVAGRAGKCAASVLPCSAVTVSLKQRTPIRASGGANPNRERRGSFSARPWSLWRSGWAAGGVDRGAIDFRHPLRLKMDVALPERDGFEYPTGHMPNGLKRPALETCRIASMSMQRPTAHPPVRGGSGCAGSRQQPAAHPLRHALRNR